MGLHNTFTCSCEYPSGRLGRWTAFWQEVGSGKGISELLISGRGSMYTVLVGEYSSGHYLCIPEQGIGCPLARLSDTFWNFERLSSLICRTDAATIISALDDYEKYRQHN